MNTWRADKLNEGTQELVTGNQSSEARGRGARELLLKSSHIICIEQAIKWQKVGIFFRETHYIKCKKSWQK